MKKAVVYSLLFVFILSGSIAQPLNPSQLKQKYLQQFKERLKDRREGTKQQPATREYKSPEMYQTYPESLRKKEEIKERKLEAEKEKEKETEEEKKKDYFLSPVVIEDDTVQVIRKARPRKLEIFASNLFTKNAQRSFSPIPQSPISDDYMLKVGDRILVYLWGNVDKQFNLTIDREGNVFIPKAGSVTLVGLSLDRAKDKMRKFLDDIYSDFEIDITLGQVSNIKVYVFGEVHQPGGYSMSGLSSLLNALDLANGPTDMGSMRRIQIYRNGELFRKVDLYSILTGQKRQSLPALTSNDIIYVPKVEKLVKLRGKVRHPAIYEAKKNEGLRKLIEYAGGFLPEASRKSIMIDRTHKGKREILSVDLADSTDKEKVIVKDGDDVSVFPIRGIREGFVSLAGHVSQPGQYAYEEGMTVRDLLKGGELLLEDTYMERADLIRITEQQRKRIINVRVDSALSGDKKYNLSLQEGDKLILYSLDDIRWDKKVTISGAVKKPGEYELYEDMRVSDLIFEAGGFLKNTYLLEAELARNIPGEASKIFSIDLKKVMNNPGGEEDQKLRENDYLFIRKIPGWKLQEVVTLEGEVKFPGKYALKNEDESVTDLIKRAGGLTDKAFLKGATFLRPSIKKRVKGKNIESVINSTQEAVLDSQGNITATPLLVDYNPERLSRIIIDLNDAMKGREEEDIVLKDGDKVFIPKKPTGVGIVGAIPSSGTITYMEGKNIKYYVNKAGGFTKNADKGELRLVKANGKVKKCDAGSEDIAPGDIIVVPQELERPTDWGRVLKDAVSILSGLATTAYILLNLK